MTIVINGTTGITNASGGTVLDTTTGLGWGQTWQNVAASRVAGTTYQNNTSRPILVVIGTNGTGTTHYVQVSVDNVTFVDVSAIKDGDLVHSIIVPVDNYYRCGVVGIFLNSWSELR